MKHWQESTALLKQAQERLCLGEPAVMAVIVGIQGSTYRRPGAKLLIEAGGDMFGNVSGGCLEQDVREAAVRLMTGQPRHVHYDTSDAEDPLWGMGLGCNGKVDLFLIPLDPATHMEPIAEVVQQLEGETAITLRWALAKAPEARLIWTESGEPGWRGEVFTEQMQPPPTLMICGAGDDAIPLAKLAHEVGFRVCVVDHRRAFLTPARFPLARQRLCVRPEQAGDLAVGARTLAVVKTHALQYDLQWVEWLAQRQVPYIGLLGPRDRRDEIRNRIDSMHHPRLYGPVGLDLGGEGAEQVALSIVAEALAVWHARRPQHLRDRATPIHAE